MATKNVNVLEATEAIRADQTGVKVKGRPDIIDIYARGVEGLPPCFMAAPPEVLMAAMRLMAVIDDAVVTMTCAMGDTGGVEITLWVGDRVLAVISEMVERVSVRAVVSAGPYDSPDEMLITRKPITWGEALRGVIAQFAKSARDGRAQDTTAEHALDAWASRGA